MIAATFLLFQAVMPCASPQASQPASQSRPAQDDAVAYVLGKPIYRSMIIPVDPEYEKRLQRMPARQREERLNRRRGDSLFALILMPLRSRFLEAHSQLATPEEIRAYTQEEMSDNELLKQRARLRLERIRQELGKPHLSSQEISDLRRDEQKTSGSLKYYMQHSVSRSASDANGPWAYIESWKLRKIAWEQYKAVASSPDDALRRWMDAAEKAGDFRIVDSALRKNYEDCLREWSSSSRPLPASPPHIWGRPGSPSPIRFGNKSVPPEPLPPPPSGELDAR